MTDNRKSGIALIAGSIGVIVTMAIHPVASGTLTPTQVERLAIASAHVHSLAMLSVILLVLGAFGLTQRLAAPDRLAFSALVFYIFAAITILIAAAVSGFIVPSIMNHMARDTPASAPQWRIAIDSMFQINQAFARIFTVAALIAIMLWSVSALRHGGLARALAIYGCFVAPLLIVGMISGRLTMDIHGMGLVILAQSIWFISAGFKLYADKALKPECDLNETVRHPYLQQSVSRKREKI